MRRKLQRQSAFSLVEVTLTLGVASLCLMAVFALLPIGVQTNRAAIGETIATSILAAATADLRSTPRTNSTSTQFGIDFGVAKTLYFTNEGTFTSNLDRAGFRLTVEFPSSPSGAFAPTYAHLRVSWPAAATVPNSSGSVETLAAFDRH